MPIIRYRDPVTQQFVPLNMVAASKLDDLTDVDTTTPLPLDGDQLTYDAATGQWRASPSASTAIARIQFTVPAGGGIIPLAHNLGEQFVVVQIFDQAGYLVAAAIDCVDDNTAAVEFAGSRLGLHTAVIIGAGGATSPAIVLPGAPEPAWSTTGSIAFAVSHGSVQASLSAVTFTGSMPLSADSWATVCALPAGVPGPVLPTEVSAFYGTAATGALGGSIRLRVDPTSGEVQARSFASRLMSPNQTTNASIAWAI